MPFISERADLRYMQILLDKCYALVRERNCKQFQFRIDAFYEKNHTRNGYGFFGGESEIRTRASVYHRTNPLAGGPLIASWVFLRAKGYVQY